MNAKKYPLNIRLDPSIIEESAAASRSESISLADATRSLPNFIQYPYTNEDAKKLEKAFSLVGKDGKPLISGKHNFLFIVGGGAILGSLDKIMLNNPIENVTGIDLHAGQLFNFKYIAERAAKEQRKGLQSFLRRAPESSNTVVNKISLIYRKEKISDKIFGYPIVVEPTNNPRSYFMIPAKGLFPEKKSINLIRGEITEYLKNIEPQKAPDLIYTSNLSEWHQGVLYNVICRIIQNNDKFPIGTTIIGSHMGKVTLSIKVKKDEGVTILSNVLDV